MIVVIMFLQTATLSFATLSIITGLEGVITGNREERRACARRIGLALAVISLSTIMWISYRG